MFPTAPVGNRNTSEDDSVRDVPIVVMLILILLVTGTAYTGVKTTFNVTPTSLDIVLLGTILNDIDVLIGG